VTEKPSAASRRAYADHSAAVDAYPFLDGDLAAAAVSRAGLAVLQVDLPTLRITAVSASAAALLGAAPTDLVGCPIRDFVADEPTGGVPLLVTGRLDGFEAPRRLRRVDGAVVEVYVWVHVLGEERPARYGAVMLTTGDERSTRVLGAASAEDQTVVGTVDGEWRVDRISVEVEDLLGYRAVDLAGASLLAAVHPSDLSGLLAGVSYVHGTGRGSAIRVRIRRKNNQWLWCRAHLSALDDSPRFAFTLRPQPDPRGPAPDRVRDLEMSLVRIAHEIRTAGLTMPSRAAAPVLADVPALGTLTNREWEVVGALVDGSRVTSIARQLHVRPGTVRNHLSSVYRKLDVGSQSELLERLRSS